jgi:hypothetical protein
LCHAVSGVFTSEGTTAVVCSAVKCWSFEHCSTSGLLGTRPEIFNTIYASCSRILFQASIVTDAALKLYRTFQMAGKDSLHIVMLVHKFSTGRSVRDCSKRCSRERGQTLDAFPDCFSNFAFFPPSIQQYRMGPSRSRYSVTS